MGSRHEYDLVGTNFLAVGENGGVIRDKVENVFDLLVGEVVVVVIGM